MNGSMDRRSMLQGMLASMGGAALAFSASSAYAQTLVQGLQPLPATTPGSMFFTQDEIAFVRAAIDRLIPPSEAGPSATEAGVDDYLDLALLTSYGAGEKDYLQGPFAQGEQTQGYQLPLTPAELYRKGIEEVDAWSRASHGGKAFAEMPAGTQTDMLTAMQQGKMELQSIPSPVFFGTFWFDTQVGYFSDPIHGGNKDMAAWKMLGFPGAFSEMRQYVGQRTPVEIEPVSLMQFIQPGE